MKFNFVYFLPVIFLLIFSCQQKPSQSDIAEAIKSMNQESEVDSSLIRVYAENNFKPIWVKIDGLTKVGRNYFNELDKVVFDGLEREDYFSKEQDQLLERIKESKDPTIYAELEMAISQSFLALASDLNIGSIDPSAIHEDWKLERKTPTVDYMEILLSISKGVGANLKESLALLRPDNPRYEELQNLLKIQLDKQAEIPRVDSISAKIEKGDQDPSIPNIRQKLAYLGDLKGISEMEKEVYDDELFQAVKKFQKRHGLIDDGVIGADFIAAINYSHSDLITKIKVNLERLRWLPDFTDNKKDKIIVNIPDYHLFYEQDGDTVFSSRVVVGKEYRQTPVFKAEMSYLVFSPTWTLPQTILWEDVIPSIKKDLSYLERNNMKVLDFQENEIDYEEVDWESLEEDEEDFPYLIRQKPGGDNPLGRVKFMFPNDYSIYIHDTPAKSLFSKDERTFSSGCIRMEKAEEFAALLLENAEDWDEEKISEAMDFEEENVAMGFEEEKEARGFEEEKKVPLDHEKDVWILYLTVWDGEGNIELREDIYGMDKKLAEALSLPLSDYYL